MKTWTKDWKRRGSNQEKIEGKAEGEIEGRKRGEALVLKRLLRRRFGELPASIEQQLDQAGTAELETWAERVLGAKTIEEVFRGSPSGIMEEMSESPNKGDPLFLRQILTRHSNINLAVLFGSLAKGRARGDSDLDLAVGGDQPLGMQEKMELIAELAEAVGRPVDLVDFATVGEPLLGQILAGGRRILGDDTLYAFVLNKHLFNQADFMPYRNRILRERRRAWIGL